MARHQKRGIDYFSLDVDIYSDRKIRRVMGRCGAEAMAVIVKVLCHIYGGKGYYIAADDDFGFDVADELGMSSASVSAVLAACVDSGLFDAVLYAQHGILTSQRIQHNYIAATKKRTINKHIEDVYRLESGAECRLSGAECRLSGAECRQRKGKQSKAKETKPLEDGRVSFAEFVSMTQGEHDDLVGRYGNSAVKRMIEMLGNYKGAHGRDYKSDYRAILSWVVRRYNEEQARGPSGRASFEREIENCDHLAEDLFADEV